MNEDETGKHSILYYLEHGMIEEANRAAEEYAKEYEAKIAAMVCPKCGTKGQMEDHYDSWWGAHWWCCWCGYRDLKE
jgi:ribosomal protein S27AE